MTPNHAAGWLRLQHALCRLGLDRRRYMYVFLGEEHCDAIHILGYGSEEELKYCLAHWRQRFPELFETID